MYRTKFSFFYVLLCVLLLPPIWVQAQQEVQLGGHRFIPTQNLGKNLRGASQIDLKGVQNALIQLEHLPNAKDIDQLKAAGVTLGSYIGGNAYYAELASDSQLPAKLNKLGLATSLVPLKPEWKLHTMLAKDKLPDWIKTADGRLKVVIRIAQNAPRNKIANDLKALGMEEARLSSVFDQVEAIATFEKLSAAAELPYILGIEPIAPPSVLYNRKGSKLSGAYNLSASSAFGGRGLEGKGRRIGIWDGDVVSHLDFGNRVHIQEYESADGNEEHGTHVAGTVLGSGYLDINARGMAPKAEAWTYNFNKGSNGLSEREEMVIARQKFGIHATQNSYGLQFRNNCDILKHFVYFRSEYEIDQLANLYPTLTHVYAAGNDQFTCPSETEAIWGTSGYGSTSRKAKNIISVGAVDDWGQLASFSSCGPNDDGRLFPLLCAKGQQVYSTNPNNTYKFLDGTSMACPTVSGHVLLLQERYAQLYHNEEMRSDLTRALLANTADDAGRPGPDFQYGYGITNAPKALIAIEKQWFALNEVENQKTITQTIQLPEGTQNVRVMIVWNDPAYDKDHKWGDKVLINDLDLRIKVGSTTYQPWVLTPEKGKVEDPAKRANDNLNNVEQVTLNTSELAGATTITAEIQGTQITNGKQPFAIVWYLEGEPKAKIISPANGDTYQPDTDAVGLLENVEAPYTVELSYDGGKNYEYLGKVAGQYWQMSWHLPKNAPITDQARLRVIDNKGKIAISDLFTIAPQVTNVNLSAPQCGLSGWKISWDKIPMPNIGYEVFAGDVQTANWTSIGKTFNNEFSIPEDKIPVGQKAAFTVAIRLADGSYGERSTVLLAKTPTPLHLTEKDLPYVNTFKELNSPYYNIQGGDATTTFYRYSSTNVTPGSNVLYFGIAKNDKNFDTNAWFDKSKNASFISELSFCEIDLTQITEPVYFHLRGGLSRNSRHMLTTSRFRVLDYDQVLKNAYGKEIVESTQHGLEDYYYILEPGKKHKLVVQHCGMKPLDMLTLNGIWIEKLDKRPDVGITLKHAIKDSVSMGLTEIPLILRNYSAQDIDKVQVRLYRNNEWVATKDLTQLKAKTLTETTMTVDLSTTDPLGDVFKIRLEALLEGDLKPENNTLEFQVSNLGDVVRHPISKLLFGEPNDPLQTIEVSKPFIYTDNGGAKADYPENQRSTLQFIPRDPNMRLRVRFHSVDLKGDSTYLTVYTNSVPQTLALGEVPPREILQGNEKDLEYVSDAKDGGLVFFFRTKEGERAPGWVATIDMVPITNPLTIVSAKASLRGTDPQAKIPVEVTIRNNYTTPQKDVIVALYSPLYKTYAVDEVIPEIAPGENTYQLRDITLKQEFITDCQMVIQHNTDSYGEDNKQQVLLAYDRYPIPGIIEKNNPYFSEMRVNDSLFTLDNPWVHVQYETSPTVPIYVNDEKVDLKYLVQFGDEDIPYSIAIWVDWNQDNNFTADELVQKDFKKGIEMPSMVLSIPNSCKPGKYRVRMAICNKNEIPEGPDFRNGIKEGDIRDITFEIEPKNPTTDDLGLLYVDAGKSGINLANNQKVTLKIHNHSLLDYKKELAVSIKLDGQEKKETRTVSVKSKKDITDTPELTLDLSKPGKHVIEATISETPEAVNEKNNTQKQIIYTINPKQDNELYCMNFQSLNNENDKQSVILPYVEQQLYPLVEGGSYTFEMLFKVKKSQPATLLQGRKFAVQLARNSEYGFPDNSIGVICGDFAFFWTEGNVVTPGTWHHLALVVKLTKLPDELSSGVTDIKIFLDGKPQNVNVYGVDIPDFHGLELGKFLNGEIDEFRCMKGDIKESEINEYMFKHYYQGGKLPENCIAEYSFDEGTGNWASICNGTPAGIEVSNPALIAQENNGIWKKHGDLLGRIDFEGMVEMKAENNRWTIKFRKSVEANKDKIRGTLTPNWAQTVFKLKGTSTPLTADHIFDFTNPVVVEAELTLFGKSYNQELTFVFEADESDACDLLSLALEKNENAGMIADLNVPTPIPTTCPILLAATYGVPTHLNKVKLTFSASAEATVYLDEEKPENLITSKSKEIDFTKPHILIVKAKNGKTKRYELSLLQEQHILFDGLSANYTYGDETVTLQGKASSKLPVTYFSTKSEVATVTNDKLAFLKPGTTDITCLQLGNLYYAAATPVTKTITVKKKAITATPNFGSTLAYGKPIAWTFAYTGLVDPNDAVTIDIAELQKAYELKNASGVSFATDAILPIGNYKLTAKSIYETEYYTLTLGEFAFSVVNESLADVLFVVNDSEGLVADAKITVGKQQATTNAKGEAHLTLQIGKEITHVATKGNIRTEGVFTPQKTGENKVTITFPKETLTISYTPDANCTISGDTQQKVANGMDATPVLVIPNEGYLFDQWSDGSKDNPRHDKKLQNALAVTAKCKQKTFTLIYETVGEGRIKSGDSKQEVAFASNAQTVEVEPITTDAHFLFWNDGTKTPQRTDQNVKASNNYRAYFSNLKAIPEAETFDIEGYPKGWVSWSTGKVQNPMQQYHSLSDKSFELDNGFLVCDNRDMANYYSDYITYIQTPRYKLDGITTDLRVYFDYSLRYGFASSDCKLEYSTDGEHWEVLEAQLEADPTTRRSYTNNLEFDKIKDKPFVTFRFTYEPKMGWYFCLDNFNLFVHKDDMVTLTYTCEPSDSGIFLIDESEEDQEEIDYGSTASDVLAKANDGYRFVGWKHGEANPLLHHVGPIFKNTTFTALFTNTDKVRLTYQTRPLNAGTIQTVAAAKPIEYELVDKGADGQKVQAVAAPGWRFAYWMIDASTSPEYTAKAVTTDRDIFAVFTRDYPRLTFIIKPSMGQLTDAKVLINNQLLSADVNNKVTLELAPGTYKYTVTATHYLTQQGELTVGKDDLEMPITLQRRTDEGINFYKVTLDKPENGTLTVMANGKTVLSEEQLEENTTLEITALPDADYVLDELTANGNKLTVNDDKAMHKLLTATTLVAKFKKKDDVAVSNSVLDAITFAPNPFTTELRIENSNAEPLRYELLNMHGILFANGLLESGYKAINTADLPEGLYILKLIAINGQVRIRKVLKQ